MTLDARFFKSDGDRLQEFSIVDLRFIWDMERFGESRSWGQGFNSPTCRPSDSRIRLPRWAQTEPISRRVWLRKSAAKWKSGKGANFHPPPETLGL
jgi:hypothetical protein